ncbi:MAG: FkbM family methyltransferase [Planctomycetota bacterium]
MLWHPHQGLWNWALIGAIRKIFPIAPIHIMIHVAIVQLDTLILFLRALFRRVSLLGPARIFAGARVPDSVSVVYLDLGTHKEGAELSLVVDRILPRVCNNFEAYGFEASRESFEPVEKKFSHRKNVRIVHKALCHALPAGGTVRIYKDMKDGIGDSLYGQTDSFEEVEAMRLSDFLRENHMIRDNRIILLRMNIEGAEYDVIKDLVESGFAGHIHGYFGMWDDVSKIDIRLDEEFRAFLARNKIDTFPFNGRDLRWFFRRKCIAYDFQTHLLKGLLKLEREPGNRHERKARQIPPPDRNSAALPGGR